MSKFRPYSKDQQLFKGKVAQKRKEKSLSRKKLVDQLDKVFSQFIRLRDANKQGVCKCCTCGKLMVWKHPKGTTHAGHFVNRKHMATRWDEKNVHAQCVKCNSFDEGRQRQHGIFIDKKYGEGTADYLEGKGRSYCKWQEFELKEKIEYYKKEVKRLKKEKEL